MSGTTTEPAVNTTPAAGQDLLLDVDVTQSCINMGVAGACTACPIALALLRSLAAAGIAVSEGSPVVVQSDSTTVRLRDGRTYGATLPVIASTFIRVFDYAIEPPRPPFQFTLRLEQWYPATPDRIERFIKAERAALLAETPPSEG